MRNLERSQQHSQDHKLEMKARKINQLELDLTESKLAQAPAKRSTGGKLKKIENQSKVPTKKSK